MFSQNIQQIYRRKLIPKLTAEIYCIFSGHLFLTIPAEGYYVWSYQDVLVSKKAAHGLLKILTIFSLISKCHFLCLQHTNILLVIYKVACSVKANMTWTTKNVISSYHFSKIFKTSTLHEYER